MFISKKFVFNVSSLFNVLLVGISSIMALGAGSHTAILNSYCTVTGNSTNYEWIESVELGTLNHTSGDDQGYADYTNLSTSLGLGSNNMITLTPGFSGNSSNDYWSVWIDYDNDGIFSDTELIGEERSHSAVSLSFTVPASATMGNTQMRIVLSYHDDDGPCGSISYGEAEDYAVAIVESTSPTCDDGILNGDEEGVDCGGTACPVCPIEYCDVTGNSTNYEWIQKVVFGDINNESGDDNGFADFRGLSTEVELGSNHDIELTPGYSNSHYNNYWKVWIDLDQNEEFDDEELVVDERSTTTITEGLQISSTALLGSTTMRIVFGSKNDDGPCESFSYGEAEDYSVVIIEGTEPTCNDGIQNGDETGVDCGGPICNDCPIQYCDTWASNTNYEWIESVAIGDFENVSGKDGGGYADYTNLSIELPAASGQTIELTPGYPGNPYSNDEFWKVWIDYNVNGEFEDDELVAEGSADSQLSLDFTVPANVTLGETRMRIIMRYSGYAEDACGAFSSGEAEDYTVNIIGAATCDDGIENGDEEGIDCGGTECDPCPVTYCETSGGTTSYEWIERIQFGTIDNTSGDNGGYGDFTSSITELLTGTSETIVLTPGFNGGPYDEFWTVWIDLDRDGGFSDTEIVAQDFGEEALSLDVTIPGDVLEGEARMRIIMRYSGYATDACGDFPSGEAEDYTVNIIQGPTCDDGIKNGDETGIDCGGSCDPCQYDLTNNSISISSLPEDVYPGNQIEVNYSVTNSGQIGILNYPVHYCLVQTQTPTHDELLANEIGYSFNEFDQATSVGLTDEGSVVIDLPGDIVLGDYFLFSYLVPDDYFEESNFPENNLTSVPLTVVIDPCIDGIQNGDETGIDCGGDCEECEYDISNNELEFLSGSNEYYAGEEFDLGIEIENVGVHIISGWEVSYFITQDVITDISQLSSHTPVFVRERYDHPIGFSFGSIQSSLQANFQLSPDLTPGQYFLTSYVQLQIPEVDSDLSNNIISIPIKIIDLCEDGILNGNEELIDCGGDCGECLPDLELQNLEPRYPVTSGEGFTVKSKHVNIGQIPMSGAEGIQYYISLDEIPDDNEIVDSDFLNQTGLELGNSKISSTQVNVPTGLAAGDYYLIGVVYALAHHTSTETLDEVTFENNTFAVPILIGENTCCNGILDGQETEIDCGGNCPPCGGVLDWSEFASLEDIYEGQNSHNKTLEVGSIHGVSGVSPTGASTYTIPIQVPAGAGGLAPQLSLSYNSQLRKTYMGYGWQVSGLSSISRMPKTTYYHDEISPIEFNGSDAFYLDGLPMYKEGAVYKLQQENYSEIKLKNQLGTGKQWFEVRDKSGIIREYGNGHFATIKNEKGKVVYWKLNKVYDQFGNYMEYHYSSDPDQVLIKSIKYGGNINAGLDHYNLIEFQYKNKPDVVNYYSHGEVTTIDESLLESVDVSTSGKSYKKYLFFYGKDQNLPLHSQLASIQEVGSDGSKLNATKFRYGNGDGSIVTESVVHSNPLGTYGEKKFADFNGDGLDDMVWIEGDYARFYLNMGDSNFDLVFTKDISEYEHGSSDFIVALEVILNAIPSIVLGPKTLTSYITSLATTTFSVAMALAANVAADNLVFDIQDVNGDSREEIVFYNPCLNKDETFQLFDITADCHEQTIVAMGLDESNSYESTEIEVYNLPEPIRELFGDNYNPMNFWVQDFDGDSKLDFLFRFQKITLFGSGQHFMISASSMDYQSAIVVDNFLEEGEGYDNATYAFGNFNGDQKTDFLITNLNYLDRSYMATLLFHDDGSVSLEELLPDNNIYFPKSRHEVIGSGDFNGDGFTDILTKTDECHYVVGYFNGSSFSTNHINPRGINIDGVATRTESKEFNRVADFNGDGLDDILFTNNEYREAKDILVDHHDDISIFRKVPIDLDYWIYYSTGNEFYSDKVMAEVQSNADLYLGDFNGDGIQDIWADDEYPSDLHQAVDYDFSYLLKGPKIHYINENPSGLKLTEVRDGYLNKTSFEYKSLTDPSIYSLDWSIQDFPINSITPKHAAVSKMTSPDGIGGTKSNEYKYGDALVHRTGLGFLGFFRTEMSSPVDDVKTVSYNEFKSITNVGQNDLYIPYPVSSENFQISTGQKLSGTYPYIEFTSLGGKRILSENIANTQNDFIGKRKLTTTVDYDDNGNLTNKSSKVQGHDGNEVASTYTSYSDFDAQGSHIPNKPQSISTTKTLIVDGGTNEEYNYSEQRTYNPQGSLSSKTEYSDLDKSITTTYSEFDGFGNPKKVTTSSGDADTDHPSRTTTVAYDDTGRFLESVTNNIDQTVSYDYNTIWGKPSLITGIDGLSVSFTYDGFGREKSVTSPTGVINTTDYSWDVLGGPDNAFFKVSNSAQGQPTSIAFSDKFGRALQSSMEDFGNTLTHTQKSYDVRGRLHSTAYPSRGNQAGLFTIYEYDELNRIKKVDNPVNDITYSYPPSTSDGQTTITSTSEDGKSHTTVTDAIGNTLSMTDAGGIVTSYTYDALGQPKTVRIGNDLVSEMTYDVYGRQTVLNDLRGFGIMTYGYDGFGRLTSQTDPKGNETELTYDALGRVDFITVDGESITDYNYLESGNGIGELGSVSYEFLGADPYVNSESYTYDEFSRVSSITENINGLTFLHQYTEYNDNNQLLEYVYPSGLVASHVYDNKGYLTDIKSDGDIVFTRNSTNVFGQETLSTFGNGLSLTNTFDVHGNLKMSKANISDVFDMEYDFNIQNGNLNWRKDFHLDADDPLVEEFTYDPGFDRLETITYGGPTVFDGQQVNMTYAPNGNILTKSDLSSKEYQYDNTKFYQVDRIEDVIPDVQLPSNISYNSAQQPTLIETDGGLSLNIQYGADDQRRYSELTTADGITDRYYLRDYELQENPDGIKEQIHYLGEGVIVVNELENESVTTNNYYIFSDHLGSISTVTDQNGDVVARQSFDAWGRKRNATDWSYDNVNDLGQNWLFRGYTGHEMLPEFDLINMNGRLYDFMNARMLSADEYSGHGGTSQGYNRYSYVLNNPLKYTDPTGEFVFGLGDPVSSLSIDIVVTGKRWIPRIAQIANLSTILASAVSNSSLSFAGLRTSDYAFPNQYNLGFQSVGEISDPRFYTGSGLPPLQEHGGTWETFGDDMLKSAEDFGNSLLWLGKEVEAGIDQDVVDGAITEVKEGNYREAAIGLILSRAKLLPKVTNNKLKNIVNDLFRELPPGTKKIGNGGAMDAARKELRDGKPVGGKFHKEKLENSKRGLERILRRHNQENHLNQTDLDITKTLLEDITDALSGN